VNFSVKQLTGSLVLQAPLPCERGSFSYERGTPVGSLAVGSGLPYCRVLGRWAASYEQGTPAGSLTGRQILGYIEKGVQTPMAQGRSTKIILMISWIRTSRLSIEYCLSAGSPAVGSPGVKVDLVFSAQCIEH